MPPARPTTRPKASPPVSMSSPGPTVETATSPARPPPRPTPSPSAVFPQPQRRPCPRTRSTYGQAASVTVQVASTTSGTPNGSVSLTVDGGASSQTATLSAAGSASFSLPVLSPGTHTLVATYAGVTAFASSSSTPLSVVINPAARSPSPSIPSQSPTQAPQRPSRPASPTPALLHPPEP